MQANRQRQPITQLVPGEATTWHIATPSGEGIYRVGLDARAQQDIANYFRACPKTVSVEMREHLLPDRAFTNQLDAMSRFFTTEMNEPDHGDVAFDVGENAGRVTQQLADRWICENIKQHESEVPCNFLECEKQKVAAVPSTAQAAVAAALSTAAIPFGLRLPVSPRAAGYYYYYYY